MADGFIIADRPKTSDERHGADLRNWFADSVTYLRTVKNRVDRLSTGVVDESMITEGSRPKFKEHGVTKLTELRDKAQALANYIQDKIDGIEV